MLLCSPSQQQYNLSSQNIIKILEFLNHTFLTDKLDTIKVVMNYIISLNLEYDFSHSNLIEQSIDENE